MSMMPQTKFGGQIPIPVHLPQRQQPQAPAHQQPQHLQVQVLRPPQARVVQRQFKYGNFWITFSKTVWTYGAWDYTSVKSCRWRAVL